MSAIVMIVTAFIILKIFSKSVQQVNEADKKRAAMNTPQPTEDSTEDELQNEYVPVEEYSLDDSSYEPFSIDQSEDILEPEAQVAHTQPIISQVERILSQKESIATPPKVSSRSEYTQKKKSTISPAVKDDIRFATPQDARRAFIYSEIFNRKY